MTSKNKIPTGLKAPDNYFDNFEDSMMEVIKANELSKTQTIINVIKPWLTLTAIFIAIAISYTAFNTNNDSQNTSYYSQDLNELFTDLEFELSEEDLIDFFIEEDLSFELTEVDFDYSDLSDEEIESLILF